MSTLRFNSTADWDADTRVIIFVFATGQLVDEDGSLLADGTLNRQDAALTPEGNPGEVEFPEGAPVGTYVAKAYQCVDGLATTNDQPFFGWGLIVPLAWDGTNLTIVPPTQVAPGQVADDLLIYTRSDEEPVAIVLRRSDLWVRNSEGGYEAWDDAHLADYKIAAQPKGGRRWSFGTCGELGINEPVRVEFWRMSDDEFMGKEDYDPIAGDASVNSGNQSGSGTGDGDIAVNHNYGGTDELRITKSGQPVDGATIRAYLATDTDFSDSTPPTTFTGSDGRWIAPLMLDEDDYVLVISKPDVIVAKQYELTVEA